MEIQSLCPGLATDVIGVDLSEPLSENRFQRIREAWHSYPVLRFRQQQISDEQLMAFSAHFGPLDHSPVGFLPPGTDRDTIPKVAIISNILENGKPIGGLGATEASWHTDISYKEEPAMASILYGIEVPNEGGDTHYCTMYGAYERLPDSLRKQIRGMKLKHDAAHDSAGKLRRGYQEVSELSEVPGAIHPIIRIHPETHRPALFLGRRLHASVVGLPLKESEAFLDELWSYVAYPEDCWVQQWQVGDAVLWDNRAVMHRRDGFDPNSRRLMHRTQIHGDRPFE